MLKPQDVALLLKLIAKNDQAWSNASLGKEMHLSSSEIFGALKRCAAADLYDSQRRSPKRSQLKEFVIHGLAYVYPAVRGPLTRGMVTGYAAPPLVNQIVNTKLQWPPVWPDHQGDTRGYSLTPLYKGAHLAAKDDPSFYELLALVDALREGRAREKTLAIDELKARIERSRT